MTTPDLADRPLFRSIFSTSDLCPRSAFTFVPSSAESREDSFGGSSVVPFRPRRRREAEAYFQMHPTYCFGSRLPIEVPSGRIFRVWPSGIKQPVSCSKGLVLKKILHMDVKVGMIIKPFGV